MSNPLLASFADKYPLDAAIEKRKALLSAREEKVKSLTAYANSMPELTAAQRNIDAGRSWGEFGNDVALSAVQGLDGLAKLPAMVYDKATTGDFYGPETQRISAMSDEREKLKSAFAQASAQEKARIAQEAGKAAKQFVGDGALGTAAQVATEFGSSFWEALKDPATLPDQLAQQAAQLGVMGKVGRGAEMLAASAAKAAPTLAATKAGQYALANSGTAGAVAAGGVLQGTDVGSETMQRLMALPDSEWIANPKFQALAKEIGGEAAKQSIASELASRATLQAAAASVVSAAVPGGSAIEKMLVSKKLGNFGAVPKAFLGEAAQEGFEEGSGAYIGNSGVKQIATSQDVWEGVGSAAGQGAYLGGVMGGGMAGVGAAGSTALDKLAESRQKFQAAEATKAAVDAASKTGDVSVFTAPESPAYSPSKALSALHEFNQLDTTDNETRDANVVKGMEILSTMENDLTALKAQTPQGKQEIQQDLDKLKATMAATDPADTQTLDGLKEKATKLEELMAVPLAKDGEVKQLNQKIQSQIKEIEAANELHGKMADFALEKMIESLDLGAELAIADAPVDVNDSAAVAKSDAAAQNIITLSMVHRDRVTPEQAKQLADNTNNGLSESARNYFRAFSEAKDAELAIKDMGKVSQDVFYGDAAKNQMGIPQYRTRVNSALASGNQRMATRTLGLLDNFVSSHTSKLSFAQEALKQANKTGVPVSVARTKQGTWEVLPEPFKTEKARRNNGGFTIEPGNPSMGLIGSIAKEAKALQAAQGELQAAYTLKFNPTKAAAAAKATSQPAVTTPVPAATTATPAPASPAAPAATQPAASPVTETPNVNQAPQAVQATQEGQQKAVPGTAVTGNDQAVNQPESPSDVTTEGNVGQASTSEGNVENQPANEQVDAAPEAETGGKLAAFNKPAVEGESFKQRNLIASDLKQSAGGDGVVTPRPLAATKDFLTKWFDKSVDLKQYLGKDWNDLTEKQQDLLLAFREKAAKWAPMFQASVGLKAANDKDAKWLFRFQDMMQFLIQTTNVGGKDVPTLEENVKTAMGYAAYSWIAENASRSAFNSPEEINAILGRSDDHEVSDFETSKLADVGTRRNLVINALGQRAVAAMGISAKKTANKDTLTRLEGAIGTHIMRVLLDTGVLEQKTVEAETMALLREAGEGRGNTSYEFLKIKRDPNGDLPNDVANIYTSVVGTQGVLDDLFSVESALKEPSLEPIPFKQRTTKNTQQGIPNLLAKIMGKENSEASFVKEGHWFLWNMLDTDAIMAMAGAKDEDTTQVHAANRLGIQAKNDGLLREITRFQDFVRAAIEPLGKRVSEVPMYFDHVVWKQQRVGIATNTVNPQTSKLQRFMLFRKSWETQVDPSNSDQLTNFKLRVAEGFGVKTDRKSMDAALADYEQVVNDPKIVSAVQAIVATVLNGESMTPAYQDAIVAGVKAGGENFHSLDALMALAHYEHANGKPFTTHLMGEIDGVTNGPMLTHILLGAANSAADLFARINKGGFFQKGSEHSQYNLAKDAGLQDLYESTTGEVVTAVVDKINTQPKMSFVWDAVWKFTGDLRKTDTKTLKKRRDIIKTPLTAVMFGSSMSRAVESMAEKFVESVYAGIEDLAKKGTEEDRKDMIKQINVLIGRDAPHWRKDMTSQQMLDTVFTPDQLKAIKSTFSSTLGNSVKKTMKQSFDPLLKRRDQLNESARLAFTLYNSAYEALRKEFMDQVMVQGEDTDKKGNHLHDLTAEQEVELRQKVAGMFPSLQTLMSLDSNQLNAGMEMMKSKRKLSNKLAYESEVVFGNPLQVPGKNKQKTLFVHGQEVVNTSPGVGMVSVATHSLDSAISHYAANESEVLNVHDAHGTGLSNFTNAARNLNRQTWNALLNYSPAEQMYEGLKRTLEGMADMAGTDGAVFDWLHPVKASLLEKMAKESFVGSVQDYLTQALVDAKLTAYEADKIKLEALKDLQYVDQYALEGGNYEVTNEDRSLAEKKLVELTGTVPQELLSKVSQLGKMLDSVEASTSVSEEIDPEDVDTDVGADSTWGAIGESGIPSDAALIKEFTSRGGKMTVKEATAFMNQRLLNSGEATGFNKFKRQLVWRLMKSLDPNMVIKYVTPSTPESEVMSRPSNPESRAWVSVDGKTGKAEIYVLSAEHQFSGLTEETLMHEMVHAAVTLAIAAGQKPGAKGAAAELVQSLEALRNSAELFINSDKQGTLKAEFGHMIANIDELVAWGMTNQDFQDKVLKNVKSQTKMGGIAQKLRDGLTMLVGIFTNYLFGDATPEQNNGMVVLINDVSALFKAADQLKDFQGDVKTLSQAYAAPINKVNSYSTADIYAALDKGAVSPAFNDQLKDLLNGIVENLHGPFGSLKASLMQNQALTPMDVWLKALDTGKAPFASAALTAGFKISDQEAYVLEQVEATVRAAMTDNAGQTTAVYAELRRLYAEAERRLKPTDFADPALYDFLFKVEAGKGNQSDYMSRFAALGLAHEGVSNLLQFNTERDTRSLVDAKTLLEKLRYLFSKALTLLNGKLTHTTEGMRADDKLKTLVEQLVDIEAKKRRQLLQQDPSFLAPVTNMVDSAANAARKKIVDLANSSPVQNSKNGVVKFAGTAVAITTNNQVGAVLQGLQKMRDQYFKEKNGLLMGMVNEMRGPKAWLEKLLRMRKKQEQDRKAVITETAKLINDSFGKKLNSEEKSAVTAVFLRTGLHSLIGKFDISGIQELLEDRNALNKSIKEQEALLQEFSDYQHYFMFQAKALAHHRTNGEVKSTLLMMNAGNIAKLYGTEHVGKMSDAQTARAEGIIDVLTSLYALKYVDPKQIGSAKQVLRDEMNRAATINGVEVVLNLHKKLENEAKATLFEGSEALMMKGHTPEIYNPHTDVRIATTPEKFRDLKLQGYESHGKLQQDQSDAVLPGGWVMVLKDGGLQPWQSGAISYRGRQAKGSKMHSGYNNPFHENGKQNTALSSNMARAKQAEIAQLFRPNPGFVPAQEKRNFMAPIMSANGTVSNWRYLMNDKLKDSALERDSSVDQVLGMLAGSMFDKQTANTVNVQVIQALKDHFNAEYKYSPSSFVKVSPTSQDAEMRDVYAMLPKETRDEISKVWGKDGLQVPYEMLDIVFGYRKASLSTVWEKEKTNLMETALIMAVESSLYQYARIRKGMSADDAEDYSKRGAVTMRRAENIWQEIVRETKDTIVVKTGTVMLDNIISNISLLRIHGVSASDMIRHHRVAFKAARAYQHDKSRVFQLEQQLSLGMLTPEEAKKASRELVMLEDAIARNPVLPLIDAGLMPTIVEDVSQDDDPYTYKSQLSRKLKEYGEKVNPMVMSAAKGIYMAHDTAPYKFLSQATQLSDFVARYTLYQHLTTKKDKPLSHEAAIQSASDSFINYDVPMHKTLQYLDDAGIVPFMKYALRIQRVLYRLAKEKPAAMLSMVLLGHMFEGLPLVTDSGMLNRLGNNPFQWGAFKYPATLDELATVNGALSLMK